MSIWLSKHETYILRHPRPGLVIECESGVCWITQKDDIVDHILQAGERLVVEHGGRLVLESMTDAKFALQEGPEELAA